MFLSEQLRSGKGREYNSMMDETMNDGCEFVLGEAHK